MPKEARRTPRAKNRDLPMVAETRVTVRRMELVTAQTRVKGLGLRTEPGQAAHQVDETMEAAAKEVVEVATRV